PPPPRLTPSWALAGPRRVTRPPPSIPLPEVSASYCTSRVCRRPYGRTGWTTAPSTTWRPGRCSCGGSTMEPDEATIAQAVARVASPQWEAFSAQLESTGGCFQPVRLKGSVTEVDRATGAVRLGFTTATQP